MKGQELRFRGLAKNDNELGSLLHTMFGFKAHRESEDWVVPASDKKLREGPKSPFTMHPAIDLRKENISDIASTMYKCIPPDYEAYQPAPLPQIRVLKDFGLLNDICEYTEMLSIIPSTEVEVLLREKILPFMINKLGAVRVTPITIDSTSQQRLLSLAKICLLAQSYLSIDQSVTQLPQKAFNQEAFRGIRPSPLDMLVYLDALTRLAPIALTLSLGRWGCAWHFQMNNASFFPKSVLIDGYFSEFFSALFPIAHKPNLIPLVELTQLSLDHISRYLRSIVDALNRLFRYVNNPLNFIDKKTQSYDLLKQLQAHSTIYLLFADLISMNYSANGYHRLNYSFSILDRLANLRKYLGDCPETKTEDEIMMELVSISQGKEIRSLFGKYLSSQSPSLGGIFGPVVENSFREIHEHWEKELGPKGKSESERLNRLRAQRNLMRHGPFLRRKQFEELFLESRATIPDSMITISFMLIIAFVLDPPNFLSFRANLTP